MARIICLNETSMAQSKCQNQFFGENLNILFTKYPPVDIGYEKLGQKLTMKKNSNVEDFTVEIEILHACSTCL